MGTAAENETSFREILRLALECKDVSGAAEHFDDDIEVIEYTAPDEKHVGKAAVMALIDETLGLFSEVDYEILDLVAAGERLAAEVVLRGIPKGQTEKIEMHYCIFDVFREGKLRSEHLYVDSRQFPAGN